MVLDQPERMHMREFDLPVIGTDDALLKVEMAGICHTDVGLYHGQVTYALPLIMGHEIVGRIVQLGPVAQRRWGVQEGDRVTVEAMARCGFCRACVQGNYKFCRDGFGYGTFTSCDRPPHLWGSYAEYMYLAPGTLLYKVPDCMSPQMATLVTVAISNGIQWTVLRGGVKLGDAVVVQGVGPIGLACIAAARESGASPIVATGLARDGERLELAREFGADVVVNVDAEDVIQRVRDATGGDLADVVVDVTGSGDAVRTSLTLVRPMGTVVSAGVTGDKTLTPLPLDALLYNETRLQGVFTFDTNAVRRALALAQRGKYPFEKLITHTFPLDQAETAVRTAGRELPDVSAIKVAIVPAD
ncbi:MAG: zinc-binding dehydrogenase [Chloroflexi bacterium]|nr:zinc-binding dehydrogenase [Chloroflexota bacterium]